MITELSAALSSLRAASDLAKIIRDSGLTLEKAEHKLKFSEIIEKLADARTEIAQAQEIIDRKNRQIADLNKLLELRGQINFEQPFYWLVSNDRRDGPYCQQCYDSSNKLIRLQPRVAPRGLWDCKTCRNHFVDGTYSPERPRVIRR